MFSLNFKTTFQSLPHAKLSCVPGEPASSHLMWRQRRPQKGGSEKISVRWPCQTSSQAPRDQNQTPHRPFGLPSEKPHCVSAPTVSKQAQEEQKKKKYTFCSCFTWTLTKNQHKQGLLCSNNKCITFLLCFYVCLWMHVSWIKKERLLDCVGKYSGKSIIFF